MQETTGCLHKFLASISVEAPLTTCTKSKNLLETLMTKYISNTTCSNFNETEDQWDQQTAEWQLIYSLCSVVYQSNRLSYVQAFFLTLLHYFNCDNRHVTALHCIVSIDDGWISINILSYRTRYCLRSTGHALSKQMPIFIIFSFKSTRHARCLSSVLVAVLPHHLKCALGH